MAPKLLVVDDNQELLQLLVQLLEEAGYQVTSAGKARTALDLARVERPQLAVLDVLLPDLMGFQLAEQLRKDHPGLPVIFLTGVFKGGKHAAEAKQKYGAVAYFEKPFEASKLLEAVSQVVPPEKRAAPPPEEEAFDVELDIDVEEDLPQDAMELTGRIKVTGGGNLTAELRGADLTATAMQKGESIGMRHAPVPPLPLARPVGSNQRRGELKNNFPSLINAFYLSRETGELGVQRARVKKIIYFERGTPVFALSNLVSDRFGQFLVRVGKIKAEQMQDAAAVAQSSKRRTGDVLIERGLLKDTERLYYVGQQVKSIIYSVFGWEEGSYQMSFRDRVRAESIKLDVHPANLIMRGIKKLYKPDRLKRLIAPDDRFIPSHQPAYQLDEIELERWEVDILPHINGIHTVTELLRKVQKPEHVVYGTLWALTALSILERRS